MQIFLNGHIFSQQKSGGISKYWAELIREMAKLKPDGRLSLYLRRNADRNIFLPELLQALQGGSVSLISLSRLWRLRGEPRLMHSPYMFGPELLTGITRILTVHDLIHKKMPARSVRAWIRIKALDFSITRADAYICVSEATKQDLYHHYPLARLKPCRVIYHGVELTLSASLPQEANYALYVGQRGGYKNFRALLEALALEPGLKELQLICAGGPGFTEEEKQLMMQLGLLSRVQHRAQVSDQELRGLYQKALALVYPSRYEGFGLPILEAMAQSCPVICASESSMAEIASGYQVKFDPNDSTSLPSVLLRLSQNPIDAAQIAQARQHAESFSWSRAARETLDFYTEVLAARCAR